MKNYIENQIEKYSQDFDAYFNPSSAELPENFEKVLLDSYREKMMELCGDMEFDEGIAENASSFAGEYALGVACQSQ